MSFPYAELESFRPLNQVLGKGSFGQVELFEKNNQEFAIKWQRYDSSAIVEIAVLRMASHPNIIKILDLIPEEERIGIVMEVAEFGTVKEAIKEQCMNKEEIIYQFLSGLAYLHFLDIQHRDLKPANLLVFNRCQLKITDFGTSKALRCACPTAPDEDEIATLWYRPPEMLLGGDEFTLASDMWSAGVTIYEILTGQLFAKEYTEVGVILEIAKKLGTPNSTSWPKLDSLPNSKWLTEIKFRRKYNLFADLKPEEQEILDQLLVYNPESRKSAYDLLRKPIFDPYRIEIPRLKEENLGIESSSAARKSIPRLKEENLGIASSSAARNIENNEYPLQICLNNLDARRPLFPDKFGYRFSISIIAKNFFFNLSEVYHLSRETLSYADQLFDYYLAVSSHTSSELRVVSVAIILIAADLKEVNSYPINRDATLLLNNEYPRETIIEMRNRILKKLEFDLILSVPHDYITLYRKVYSPEVLEIALEIEKIAIGLNYPYRRDPKIQGLFCLGTACLYLNHEFEHSQILPKKILNMAKNLLKNYPLLEESGIAVLASIKIPLKEILQKVVEIIEDH